MRVDWTAILDFDLLIIAECKVVSPVLQFHLVSVSIGVVLNAPVAIRKSPMRSVLSLKLNCKAAPRSLILL